MGPAVLAPVVLLFGLIGLVAYLLFGPGVLRPSDRGGASPHSLSTFSQATSGPLTQPRSPLVARLPTSPLTWVARRLHFRRRARAADFAAIQLDSDNCDNSRDENAETRVDPFGFARSSRRYRSGIAAIREAAATTLRAFALGSRAQSAPPPLSAIGRSSPVDPLETASDSTSKDTRAIWWTSASDEESTLSLAEASRHLMRRFRGTVSSIADVAAPLSSSVRRRIGRLQVDVPGISRSNIRGAALEMVSLPRDLQPPPHTPPLSFSETAFTVCIGLPVLLAAFPVVVLSWMRVPPASRLLRA